MRRDFCSFLLTICPCLREYGNISYTKQNMNNNNSTNNARTSTNPSETNTEGTSSSSTSPDVEGQRRTIGHNNLEDSFHYVASRMNAMIVSQPKKAKLFPPQMTIESPD